MPPGAPGKAAGALFRTEGYSVHLRFARAEVEEPAGAGGEGVKLKRGQATGGAVPLAMARLLWASCAPSTSAFSIRNQWEGHRALTVTPRC
jgi:hypothetical protein